MFSLCIARKRSSCFRDPAQEVISPDYIASKVAEQIVIPEISAEVDSATVADLVAEKIGNVAGGDIDYDYLAAKVAQQIELPEVQKACRQVNRNRFPQ